MKKKDEKREALKKKRKKKKILYGFSFVRFNFFTSLLPSKSPYEIFEMMVKKEEEKEENRKVRTAGRRSFFPSSNKGTKK